MTSCPKCGDVDLKRGQCPECGYKPRQKKQGEQKTPQRDPKCSFESGNVRCVLDAVWYPDNRFKGYCALHDEESKRNLPPWEAQEQLKRIRTDPMSYARDLLESSWRKERELLVQKTIEQHPEWQRGEDEGRTEYAKRMLAIGKKLGKGIRARYRHE